MSESQTLPPGMAKFVWPVEMAGAYIIVETKTIWFWQLKRHLREGWDFDYKAPTRMLRIKMERCVG